MCKDGYGDERWPRVFQLAGESGSPRRKFWFLLLRLSASRRSVGFEFSTRVKKKRKIFSTLLPSLPLLECHDWHRLTCFIYLLRNILYPTASGLLRLLRPFKWQYLHVPLLPMSCQHVLKHAVDAKEPFLIGTYTSVLER